MKSILFTLLSLSVILLYGQKIEEKTISNSAIKSIIIEGDAIFKITIKTSTTKNIKITSNIEGEYTSNTNVVSKVIDKSALLITCDYHKLNYKTDDKLNAHKVHSIEISLEIPEHLSLNINSEIASAKISGTYKYLLLELNQGNAQLLNFSGNATINTFNGNIDIETSSARIKAKTKTGLLKTEKITESQNHIEIKSINGNINICKTKN